MVVNYNLTAEKEPQNRLNGKVILRVLWKTARVIHKNARVIHISHKSYPQNLPKRNICYHDNYSKSYSSCDELRIYLIYINHNFITVYNVYNITICNANTPFGELHGLMRWREIWRTISETQCRIT